MFVRAALAAAAGSFLTRRAGARTTRSFVVRTGASARFAVAPRPAVARSATCRPPPPSARGRRPRSGRRARRSHGTCPSSRTRGRAGPSPAAGRARTPQPVAASIEATTPHRDQPVEDRRDLLRGLPDRDDPRQSVRAGARAATGPRPSRGRRRSGRRRGRRRSRRARHGRSSPSSCPRTGRRRPSATTSPRCCSGVKLAIPRRTASGRNAERHAPRRRPRRRQRDIRPVPRRPVRAIAWPPPATPGPRRR